MKAVIIKIFSSIKITGEEAENIEILTEGKFYIKNNGMYLSYKETELSGMAGDNTIVKMKNDKVTMKRYGNNFSEMVFELGKRNVSDYTTPYGNFVMENLPKKLAYEFDENGNGSVEIEYYLSIKGLSESFNKLNILVKSS